MVAKGMSPRAEGAATAVSLAAAEPLCRQAAPPEGPTRKGENLHNGPPPTLGFEPSSGLRPTKLRNNMDAPQYKHVGARPIFLK